LDDLIAQQLGPVRHTMAAPEPGTLAAAAIGGIPERQLTVHATTFVYGGEADPSAPGGIAVVDRGWAPTSSATGRSSRASKPRSAGTGTTWC
jgi:hypothetical protein